MDPKVVFSSQELMMRVMTEGPKKHNWERWLSVPGERILRAVWIPYCLGNFRSMLVKIYNLLVKVMK